MDISKIFNVCFGYMKAPSAFVLHPPGTHYACLLFRYLSFIFRANLIVLSILFFKQARAVRIAGLEGYREYMEANPEEVPATTADHLAVAKALRDLGAFNYTYEKRNFGAQGMETTTDLWVPASHQYHQICSKRANLCFRRSKLLKIFGPVNRPIVMLGRSIKRWAWPASSISRTRSRRILSLKWIHTSSRPEDCDLFVQWI